MVRGGTADPSGGFVVELVPAGAYSVTASRPGFASEVADITVGEGGRDGVELKLSRQDGVTLRAIDGRDGRAIYATVTVFDQQGRIVHDTRMSFRAPDVKEIVVPIPPGSYTATVAAPYYAPRSVSFTAPSTQTVTLTPGGTILLQSKHSARRGYRLLDAGGMPYPRFGQPVSSRELLPGTLPLEQIAPGTYTVQLLDDGGAVVNSQQVLVREAETVRVEL